MKLTNNQTHQNVTFVDGDDPYMSGYATAVDRTRQDQDTTQLSLSEFFSRPIKIAQINWGSTTATGSLNPWSLFFSDKRVINRLTNYSLMRATLKVKFVLNGNAFLYGRMLVGYSPYQSSPTFGMVAYDISDDAVQLSQLPHIFLNPTTSTGGVITCPFFYNRNYVSIPKADYDELGMIHYIALTGLNHATDLTAAALTIQVFAWAEDVQLSVPTSVDSEALIPQAGEISQANSSGTVSGPATSIAKIANAFSNIPYIAPYAKATELAASTVASIASRFGYCRPSVTRSPEFVRIMPTSSFALTNTPDTSLKLSVDHLQESTVDPRISGIEEEDMLSIVNIAKRESYFSSFVWSRTDGSGDLLWNTRVTPGVWRRSFADAFHFPATAMAALPFRYWTGTLNYRFQIVCSGFHKGRLAVCWDPNFLQNSPPEYNVLHSEIIDIADTTDFTISIANGQEFTLLHNTMPGVTSLTEVVSETQYLATESFANGVIGVFVLNALTTPSSEVLANVTVNCFISAGDDFKVFVPFDHFQHFVATTPESLGLIADPVPEDDVLEEQSGTLIGTNSTQEDMPETPEKHSLFEADTADHTNLVFTGESIPSFRGMLKRYALWRTILPNTTTAHQLAMFKFAIFPFQRGRYPNAPDTTTGVFPYAYANTLLLHWVTMAFAGFRGNMRYKVVPRIYWSISPIAMSVMRYSDEGLPEYTAPTIINQPSYTSRFKAARTAIRFNEFGHINDSALTGTNGMAWVNSDAGTLEFEVPWYSRFRFAGGRHFNWVAADTWGLGGFYLFITGLGTTSTPYDVYSAAGEDFQTYFYQGLPRLYYETIPPVAA